MELGRYQLQAQLGAGADGIAYQAWDPLCDERVEVRVLHRADIETPSHKRLRRAALLNHPVALAVREARLDHEPPYCVLDHIDAENLQQAIGDDLPLPTTPALQIGRPLAEVLLAAHRLGLCHGKLSPRAIRLADAGTIHVDFTGLSVRPPDDDASQAFDRAFQAPELGRGPINGAADVYSLGAILFWLIHGRIYERPTDGASPDRKARILDTANDMSMSLLQEWLPRLLHEDPSERRLVHDVLNHLVALEILEGRPAASAPITSNSLDCSWDMLPSRTEHTAGRDASIVDLSIPGSCRQADAAPTQLGRFRLVEKLGEGGFGAVYRAEDIADGNVVAIKLFQRGGVHAAQAMLRLRKEARLLAQVNNPFVANFIELNEDGPTPYLVLEYVHGKSLNALLSEHGRLDERLGVQIMADVARALAEAHQRGIVHRDIKPDNILLTDYGPDGVTAIASPRVKLCDFGLARHIDQSASLQLTAEGATVGTPLYASPEQCYGETVDSRSDVYSLGATLFHVLAGRPPFIADTAAAVFAMHAKEPPPDLRTINPALSEAICRLVEKALAKHPGHRFPDAEAMLLDLERVLHGEPTDITLHPRLPDADPTRVFEFNWSWDLEASPEQLWPHVSNTDRLNRAVGIPAVEFTAEPDEQGGTRRFGRFRKAGVSNVWREHPFEWIEGQRLGVLREYSAGCFKWLATWTELHPRPGGGTTLHHQVRLEPRGWLGRMVARVEVGHKGRRRVEQVYRRIDAFLKAQCQTNTLADPFEALTAPRRGQRERLNTLLDRLTGLVDPAVAEKLGDFLRHASPQDVARIRPLALARRLGVDNDPLVAACLRAAHEGLLILLWDVICPVCRIPSGVRETLRALSDHAHCEACNLDFPTDFANAVEMIFRVHPQVRASELRTYCIGGPAHFPHVAAQLRVGPGERAELNLALAEGAYRVRGPQLPYTLDLRVDALSGPTRWDVFLAPGSIPGDAYTLRAGGQVVTFVNEYNREVLVRLERVAPRADALTAARASSLALFRELFPGEVLSAGQLASVATVTFVVMDLDRADVLYDRLGDGRAFHVLHEQFRRVEELIRREGGAVVKTVGEGLLAAFDDPVAAVRAGLVIPEAVAHVLEPHAEDLDPMPRARVGVHRGPALAATINDHLDYFGSTIRHASQLLASATGGAVALTSAVAGDSQVAALLQARGFVIEISQTPLTTSIVGPIHQISEPAPLSGLKFKIARIR